MRTSALPMTSQMALVESLSTAATDAIAVPLGALNRRAATVAVPGVSGSCSSMASRMPSRRAESGSAGTATRTTCTLVPNHATFTSPLGRVERNFRNASSVVTPW